MDAFIWLQFIFSDLGILGMVVLLWWRTSYSFLDVAVTLESVAVFAEKATRRIAELEARVQKLESELERIG